MLEGRRHVNTCKPSLKHLLLSLLAACSTVNMFSSSSAVALRGDLIPFGHLSVNTEGLESELRDGAPDGCTRGAVGACWCSCLTPT